MSKLNDALIKYDETFGRCYPLNITDMRPSAEHIKIIEQAIRENKPVTEQDSRVGIVY